MKILLVVSLGKLTGGAEKCVFMLKENLEARGHQIKIISSDSEVNSKLPYYSDIRFFGIYKPKRSHLSILFYQLWNLHSFKCIKDTIKEFQPDIIHFHTMPELSPSAFFAIGNIPSILTIHGPETLVSGIMEWSFPLTLFTNGIVNKRNLTFLGKRSYIYHRYFIYPLFKLGIKKLKTIVSPSKYMVNVIKKEKFGVPIKQIYNGINLPNATKIHNKNNIIYVGRLEYAKGVHILLKAMKNIIKIIPQAHLDIVGDGSYRAELEEYVKNNNLQRNIKFHGWLEGFKLNKIYGRSTIVSVPSIWPENFPTVCIEALAYGRPVVGSRSGGIPELIKNGENGKITTVGNASQLAKAIISILKSKNFDKFYTQCTSSVSHLNIKGFIDNHEKLYREIIEENKKV